MGQSKMKARLGVDRTMEKLIESKGGLNLVSGEGKNKDCFYKNQGDRRKRRILIKRGGASRVREKALIKSGIVKLGF